MELFLLSRRPAFAPSGRDCRKFFGWRGCRGGGLRFFFGSRLSLLLSSSSFFFPLSSLGAGSGFVLSFCALALQDHFVRRRQVRRATCHVSLVFFCFLSARAGPPSPSLALFSFSFSLSLFLSFSLCFLSCMHAQRRITEECLGLIQATYLNFGEGLLDTEWAQTLPCRSGELW